MAKSLVFFLIVFSFIYASCSKVKKNVVGESYFAKLRSTVDREFNYNFKNPETTFFYILFYDSMCSCNGKYTQLIAQIINSHGKDKHVILLKNDVRHVIENSLDNGYVTFLKDTSKILEKNGHLFRFDKVFIIKNSKYENMFDFDDKSIRTVKQYFDL